MAITITKPKPQVQDAPQVVLSDYADTIDEIGTVTAQIDKIEAEIAERNKKELEKLGQLRKKLAPLVKTLNEKVNAALAESGDDETFVERGAKFQAEVGKKASARKVTDMPMVRELLDAQDPELFMKLAKVNLGDLDDYLTPQERDVCITTDRTKREVKIAKRV